MEAATAAAAAAAADTVTGTAVDAVLAAQLNYPPWTGAIAAGLLPRITPGVYVSSAIVSPIKGKTAMATDELISEGMNFSNYRSVASRTRVKDESAPDISVVRESGDQAYLSDQGILDIKKDLESVDDLIHLIYNDKKWTSIGVFEKAGVKEGPYDFFECFGLRGHVPDSMYVKEQPNDELVHEYTEIGIDAQETARFVSTTPITNAPVVGYVHTPYYRNVSTGEIVEGHTKFADAEISRTYFYEEHARSIMHCISRICTLADRARLLDFSKGVIARDEIRMWYENPLMSIVSSVVAFVALSRMDLPVKSEHHHIYGFGIPNFDLGAPKNPVCESEGVKIVDDVIRLRGAQYVMLISDLLNEVTSLRQLFNVFIDLEDVRNRTAYTHNDAKHRVASAIEELMKKGDISKEDVENYWKRVNLDPQSVRGYGHSHGYECLRTALAMAAVPETDFEARDSFILRRGDSIWAVSATTKEKSAVRYETQAPCRRVRPVALDRFFDEGSEYGAYERSYLVWELERATRKATSSLNRLIEKLSNMYDCDWIQLAFGKAGKFASDKEISTLNAVVMQVQQEDDEPLDTLATAVNAYLGATQMRKNNKKKPMLQKRIVDLYTLVNSVLTEPKRIGDDPDEVHRAYPFSRNEFSRAYRLTADLQCAMYFLTRHMHSVCCIPPFVDNPWSVQVPLDFEPNQVEFMDELDELDELEAGTGTVLPPPPQQAEQANLGGMDLPAVPLIDDVLGAPSPQEGDSPRTPGYLDSDFPPPKAPRVNADSPGLDFAPEQATQASLAGAGAPPKPTPRELLRPIPTGYEPVNLHPPHRGETNQFASLSDMKKEGAQTSLYMSKNLECVSGDVVNSSTWMNLSVLAADPRHNPPRHRVVKSFLPTSAIHRWAHENAEYVKTRLSREDQRERFETLVLLGLVGLEHIARERSAERAWTPEYGLFAQTQLTSATEIRPRTLMETTAEEMAEVIAGAAAKKEKGKKGTKKTTATVGRDGTPSGKVLHAHSIGDADTRDALLASTHVYSVASEKDRKLLDLDTRNCASFDEQETYVRTMRKRYPCPASIGTLAQLAIFVSTCIHTDMFHGAPIAEYRYRKNNVGRGKKDQLRVHRFDQSAAADTAAHTIGGYRYREAEGENAPIRRRPNEDADGVRVVHPGTHLRTTFAISSGYWTTYVKNLALPHFPSGKHLASMAVGRLAFNPYAAYHSFYPCSPGREFPLASGERTYRRKHEGREYVHMSSYFFGRTIAAFAVSHTVQDASEKTAALFKGGVVDIQPVLHLIMPTDDELTDEPESERLATQKTPYTKRLNTLADRKKMEKFAHDKVRVVMEERLRCSNATNTSPSVRAVPSSDAVAAEAEVAEAAGEAAEALTEQEFGEIFQSVLDATQMFPGAGPEAPEAPVVPEMVPEVPSAPVQRMEVEGLDLPEIGTGDKTNNPDAWITQLEGWLFADDI